jgi:hypothetical protein
MSSYCPRCGSGSVTLKNDTSVSWGRAVVGWALLGPIGGAVGAVTGDDRTANACLECGETWKAQDLYLVQTQVKQLTGVQLNLSKNTHRQCLEEYIHAIPPIYAELEAARNSDSRKDHKGHEDSPRGILATVAGSICGMFAIALTQNMFLGFVAFIVSFGLVGAILPQSKAEKALDLRFKEQKELLIKEAEGKYNQTVSCFKNKWRPTRQ